MSDFLQQSLTEGLESELVQQRPVPRDEFVVALVRKIDGRSERSRKGRVGAAFAMAGVVLVALGASGGAGYAYSSASTAVRKIASAVHLDQSHRIQRPDSSSHAQYGPVPVPPFPPPKSKPPPTPKPPTTPGKGRNTGGGTGSVAGGSKSGGGSGSVAGASKSLGRGAGTGTAAGQSSGLPFTGLSLLFPVLLGIGLIVFGVILRRRGRATPR